MNGKKTTNWDEAKFKHEESLRIACAIIERYFQEQINHKDAQKYIHERKLSMPELGSFNIGYAPSGNQLLAYAHGKGLKTDILEEIGILKHNEENINTVFVNEGLSQSERLTKLNQVAIQQMKILTRDSSINKLTS